MSSMGRNDLELKFGEKERLLLLGKKNLLLWDEDQTSWAEMEVTKNY